MCVVNSLTAAAPVVVHLQLPAVRSISKDEFLIFTLTADPSSWVAKRRRGTM